MEILFYIFAVLSVYSYFLYPLILKILPECKSADTDVDSQPGSELPFLSLIITVHNEAGRIRDKLDNTLKNDYPPELLEIIVASDFSTDETDDIVTSYADKGVRLVRADERKGKEYAQLCAIRESRGEILVFSDVATQIPAEALRILAMRFADKHVGALSSEDQFISNDGRVVGEGAYVKYEMWLRRLESNRAGLVAITCPDVVGIYNDVQDSSLEYRRKMRTVIRGITAIARHPEVLNPFRMGLFAFQVWSHKIMRWGVPWFMAAFLLLTLILQGQGMIYSLALIAQLVFYALALLGWLFTGLRENTLVKIIFFFVQTNLALAQATVLFMLGKRMTVWTPSKR